MILFMLKRVVARSALASACALSLFGCAGTVALGPDAVKGKPVAATVDMQEVQAAYIGSGTAGTGVLTFRGQQYPFQVAGAGVGGIGLSTVEARGDVYNLTSLSQFPGTYGQARYGFAIGTSSAGDLWLQNESGVIMRLKAKREGLMLSLGGDAVVIAMSK
jgi:hypothetical protein